MCQRDGNYGLMSCNRNENITKRNTFHFNRKTNKSETEQSDTGTIGHWLDNMTPR
jgi:hypothetical protein